MRAARIWEMSAGIIALSAFLLPWIFMIRVSTMPEGAGMSGRAMTDVSQSTLSNFGTALEGLGDPLGLFLRTLALSFAVALGQIVVCSMTGYALAQVDFRGRSVAFGIVLLTMMLPDQVVAIPRFLIFRGLGLVDTYHPLVWPAIFGGAPFWPSFFIFLYRQYFRTFSREVVQAAELDGCGHFRIWWAIMLPCARPVTVTVALFSFLATWNDLWQPLIYLFSTEKRTMTLALASFNRTYNTAVETMMAAAGIVLLPCVVFYFLVQRFFLRGAAVGAGKG